MLERISPVLLVLVVAGGFVASSALPATAEGPDERRDRLHAVRPIAAPPINVTVDLEEVVAMDLEHAAYGALIDAALAEQAYAELAERALAARSRRVSVSSSPSRGSCNGDVDCFLECTRAIESTNNYGAVSSGGTFRGAYQFMQPTWDAAVAGAGHVEYSGMPADQVPAEVQDAAAAHLYSVSGTRPWGGRC